MLGWDIGTSNKPILHFRGMGNISLYEIDQLLTIPQPQVIGLFDDVLTTGAHFKAAQSLLNKAFPGVRVIGLFIARRVPETIDVEDIFENLDE